MTGTLQTPLDDSRAGDLLEAGVENLMVLLPADESRAVRLIDVGDEFLVRVRWRLAGRLVPYLSGRWLVELFVDAVGGTGGMTGSLGVRSVDHRLDTPSPALFETSFVVSTAAGEEGVYRLLVTLGLSLTGDPGRLSELYGFVESVPIRIQSLPDERG